MEYRIFGPKEYTVDVCALLNGTWSHITVDLISAFLKRASKGNNLFHPCPFAVCSLIFSTLFDRKCIISFRISFQGWLYLHDLIVDENSYSVVSFIPEGDYIYRTRLVTQYDKKEHLLIEVRNFIQFKSIGIFN